MWRLEDNSGFGSSSGVLPISFETGSLMALEWIGRFRLAELTGWLVSTGDCEVCLPSTGITNLCYTQCPAFSVGPGC